MKLLLLAGAILALVVLSTADVRVLPKIPTYPNGCVYIEGRCAHGCPDGTHDYHTFCSPKMPEATCDEPNPVLGRGAICDYSACYCNEPTVRDTASGKCVPLDQCPRK